MHSGLSEVKEFIEESVQKAHQFENNKKNNRQGKPTKELFHNLQMWLRIYGVAVEEQTFQRNGYKKSWKQCKNEDV